MSHSSDLPNNESASLARIGELLCEAIAILKLEKKQEPFVPVSSAPTTTAKPCQEEASEANSILSQIQKYIGEALEVTPAQVAYRFDFSRYTAHRHLKALIEQGRISKDGRGKSVRYRLKNENTKKEHHAIKT